MVRLIHKKVPGTDYMYYGEQAYNFSLSRPYRQFIVEAFEENGYVVLKNYEFDKWKYQGVVNLDQIKYDKSLTYKEHCDMIMVYDPNKNRFVGSFLQAPSQTAVLDHNFHSRVLPAWKPYF